MMEYMAAQMDRQIEGAIRNQEQLEADAARYRWLRDTTNWASNSSGERIDVRNSPELWDSAIDEAIARAALLPDNAPLIGALAHPNRADGYRAGTELGD